MNSSPSFVCVISACVLFLCVGSSLASTPVNGSSVKLYNYQQNSNCTGLFDEFSVGCYLGYLVTCANNGSWSLIQYPATNCTGVSYGPILIGANNTCAAGTYNNGNKYSASGICTNTNVDSSSSSSTGTVTGASGSSSSTGSSSGVSSSTGSSGGNPRYELNSMVKIFGVLAFLFGGFMQF